MNITLIDKRISAVGKSSKSYSILNIIMNSNNQSDDEDMFVNIYTNSVCQQNSSLEGRDRSP